MTSCRLELCVLCALLLLLSARVSRRRLRIHAESASGGVTADPHGNPSRLLPQQQCRGGRGLPAQVRGSTTPVEEQAYILHQSHSVGLIAQDAASLEKLLPHITGAKSLNGNGSSNGTGSLNGNGAVRAAQVSRPLHSSSPGFSSLHACMAELTKQRVLVSCRLQC